MAKMTIPLTAAMKTKARAAFEALGIVEVYEPDPTLSVKDETAAKVAAATKADDDTAAAFLLYEPVAIRGMVRRVFVNPTNDPVEAHNALTTLGEGWYLGVKRVTAA